MDLGEVGGEQFRSSNMSKLPKVGEVLQLFGVGCEGCGNFRGEFEVLSVVEGKDVSLVLNPLDIHCEGQVEKGAFSHLTLSWNQDLEFWQTSCGDHEVVVHISGYYHGPPRLAA